MNIIDPKHHKKIIVLGEHIHLSLKDFYNRFPNHSFYKNLQGACAIGSFILYEKLKEYNIKSSFIYGTRYSKRNSSSHCWVEYKDLIYDITATQFGVNKKVFCTSKTNENYQYSVKDSQAIADIKRYWSSQNIRNFSFYWKNNSLILNPHE